MVGLELFSDYLLLWTQRSSDRFIYTDGCRWMRCVMSPRWMLKWGGMAAPVWLGPNEKVCTCNVHRGDACYFQLDWIRLGGEHDDRKTWWRSLFASFAIRTPYPTEFFLSSQGFNLAVISTIQWVRGKLTKQLIAQCTSGSDSESQMRPWVDIPIHFSLWSPRTGIHFYQITDIVSKETFVIAQQRRTAHSFNHMQYAKTFPVLEGHCLFSELVWSSCVPASLVSHDCPQPPDALGWCDLLHMGHLVGNPLSGYKEIHTGSQNYLSTG